MKPWRKGLLLSGLLALLLVAMAAPARASLTPVNTAIRGTGTDSLLTAESTGLHMACPISELTGSISSGGNSFSVAPVFFSGGGVTCTESLFGSSVLVTCRGNLTFRVTSSSFGLSASGTIAFDSDYQCVWDPVLGSTSTIRGPQSPTNCTWTYTQSSRVMRLGCSTIAVDGGSESGWSGSYFLSPVITVS